MARDSRESKFINGRVKIHRAGFRREGGIARALRSVLTPPHPPGILIVLCSPTLSYPAPGVALYSVNLMRPSSTSFAAVVGCFLLFAVVGCATTSEPSERRDRNFISQEEIQEHQDHYSNAYDLVQALKPQWLTNRRGEVVVFFNGARHGGPEALRDFRLPNLVSMRYLGIEDSFRYVRSDHPTVVILVEAR